MSFSSGAYFGSHSTVSHGRAASAFRVARLVWIGPLSSASTTGRSVRPARPGPARPGPARPRRVVPVETAEQGDEVAGSLGAAGEDDQPAPRVVEHAEQRALPRLPRRRDPQLSPARRPGVREVGMREGLGLIPEQEVDVARRGLPLQEPEAQPGVVDGVRVLPPLEGVPRPAPAVAPFRRTTLR